MTGKFPTVIHCCTPLLNTVTIQKFLKNIHLIYLGGAMFWGATPRKEGCNFSQYGRCDPGIIWPGCTWLCHVVVHYTRQGPGQIQTTTWVSRIGCIREKFIKINLTFQKLIITIFSLIEAPGAKKRVKGFLFSLRCTEFQNKHDKETALYSCLPNLDM